MINFLHTYLPETVLISLGKIHVYWYGLFIVAGVLAALSVSLKLTKKTSVPQNSLFDLAFWLIIFGILGARIYHVFLEFGYYIENPLNIFKVWEGGLAIHGAIIAGLIVVFVFCKKHKINFYLMATIIAPGLALAQAIGRWGNYFNQELFGKPTNLPWGIPIEMMRRPHIYISDDFFHPTFLYESLGNFIIFGILLWLSLYFLNKKKTDYVFIITAYLIMYSLLRFLTEFIRIDKTPYVFGWRLPQVASLLLIIVSVSFLVWKKIKKGKAELSMKDGTSPR